jgi:hypothetical protein
MGCVIISLFFKEIWVYDDMSLSIHLPVSDMFES